MTANEDVLRLMISSLARKIIPQRNKSFPPFEV